MGRNEMRWGKIGDLLLQPCYAVQLVGLYSRAGWSVLLISLMYHVKPSS